jgi:hypothetical protein
MEEAPIPPMGSLSPVPEHSLIRRYGLGDIGKRTIIRSPHPPQQASKPPVGKD